MSRSPAAACLAVVALACLSTATARAQTAPGTPASPTELDAVQVRGVRVGKPAQAGKLDIPPLETAQAISVVDATLLRKQGITRLADALRNVAGVSRSSTYGYYDAYQLRGFDAAYGSLYLDGLTSANVAGAVNELAGVEQVEVVKGPAAALYGASPLGGVVNLVSKRPRPDAFVDLGVAAGAWDLREATVDANGPLGASGDVLGRVNLVYRDGGDFVRFSGKHRIYLAPSLSWQLGEDTTLTLLGRYQRDDDAPWSPVSAWGTLLPNANGPVPVRRAINGGGANAAYFDQRSRQVGYVFEHRFGEAASFTQTVRHEEREVSWDRWIFAAGFVDDDIRDGVQHGRILGRLVYGPFHQQDRDLAGDSRLSLKFATGPLSHQVALGFDYRSNRNDFASGAGNFNPDQNPLDLYAPDYDRSYVRDPASAYDGGDWLRQTGWYLHDHVRIGERFTLTVGGRWDEVRTSEQADSKFSPHAGATWSLDDASSLYASWSESYVPTPAWQATFDGSRLPPETGRNVEAGYKLQARDGRLAGMVSVFRLVRQNVATDDPEHPMFYVVTGEQRSEGVEVEGQWHPNDAFELHGAYAHIDAEITRDNTYPVGIPLPNVPRDSLSLWGKYTLRSGALRGLGLSLGVVHNSDKHFFEYADRLYTLPAYTLWDAGASYAFGRGDASELQVGVSNLTDERFYPDAAGLDRVTPGEPRAWRVSLRHRF